MTDRVIIVNNGSSSLTLTDLPYTVQNTEGFDTVSIKLNTAQGYDQDGATLVNSNLEIRPLVIRGQIYAESAEDMESLRLALLEAFYPKVPITIKQSYGGVERAIVAYTTKLPEIKFSGVSLIQNYSVTLKAMMPYWEDYSSTVVQIANTIGAFHFPVETPTTFGVISASKIANITNDTAMEIGLTLTFSATGSVTNPTLTNVYTQEVLTLNCTMSAGEVITVTTGNKKTVTRTYGGASSNYISVLDLAGGGYTFLVLNPGTNVFRLSADSGEDLLTCKIAYKNRYIGV